MQTKKRFSASNMWLWRFPKRYGLKDIGKATSDEIIATKMSLTESRHYKWNCNTEVISSMIANGTPTR